MNADEHARSRRRELVTVDVWSSLATALDHFGDHFHGLTSAATPELK